MEFLFDTANLEQIKKLYDILPCEGVATNPSIQKEKTRIPLMF